MSRFVNTRGKASFGVAICSRCSRLFPIVELRSDPNYPGLKVCKDDLDVLDPYRIPPPPTERITLPFVRPDTPLTGGGNFVPDFLEPPH